MVDVVDVALAAMAILLIPAVIWTQWPSPRGKAARPRPPFPNPSLPSSEAPGSPDSPSESSEGAADSSPPSNEPAKPPSYEPFFLVAGEVSENGTGTPFVDANHLKNFLSYLFTCSKKHKPNALTPLNHYTLYGRRGSVTKRACVTPNSAPAKQADLAEFKNKWTDEISDAAGLAQDRNYVAYIVLFGSRVVTNLLAAGSGAGKLLPVMDSELATQIFIPMAFGGNAEAYRKALAAQASLVRKACMRPPEIVHIQAATREEKEVVEGLLHDYIAKITGRRALIAMSHHDSHEGEPHHVHRITFAEFFDGAESQN